MHFDMKQQPTKPRTLEVTVLSAEDLRINGKPTTKNVYVVVRAESITSHTTAMKEDEASGGDGGGGGGGFHSWNEKFIVDMDMHARSITFEVKCKTPIGVKDVGVARIAVSDFLGGVVPDHCLQVLSYRLRDWDGLRNGIIKFSVRVVAPPVKEAEATENVVGSSGLQNMDAESSSDGVVTGVPVCLNPRFK